MQSRELVGVVDCYITTTQQIDIVVVVVVAGFIITHTAS